jgi:hypothetical protein
MASCQYDPWADGFQTHQVADKDVQGTYVVDTDSQTRQIKLAFGRGALPINKSATILLSPDHTAEHIQTENSQKGGFAGCDDESVRGCRQ